MNSIKDIIRNDFILKDIHEGYLVGGCIRDILLNKDFYDRDIAIKNAENFAIELSQNIDATFITLDSKNKIYRLVLKDKENYIDISELRGENIENDLLMRDFTINAVAYDLKNDCIIDVTNGLKDCKNGILRCIREENFIDDPLRILRAYRFMSTTGFSPDEKLLHVINKHLLLIEKPAKERIHDEIMKLFGGKYASKTLLRMLDDGILEMIFPCVSEMKKVPPNPHHHLDLIHHAIETVRQIEILYDFPTSSISSDLNALYSVCLEKVREHLNKIDFGGYPRINHLKLAGFLHDIGKFSTWTIEESGRHRFIKHDIKGAEIVVPLLKKLKFSNKQIEYISDMIRKHIYPSSVISAPEIDNKIMMRYVRKMENNVIDNIILAKADRLSAQGVEVTKEMTETNIRGLDQLLKFYLDVRDTIKPLPKLIDGNEIMKILNIKPSPILGKIVNELHEAQINGDINTKVDAIEFVKNYSLL